MSRQWTENQKLAIESRQGSVLVSAAAGSGKTACLVERVTGMITDSENPVPIDRMLIVTFTNAAAAELRQRISSKLTALLAKNPSDRYLRRQLVTLPFANIATVDSFCSNLVREFAHKLSIDEDFRIADNEELDLIKSDAVRETLERMYEKGDVDFFEFIEAFSSPRDDTPVMGSIIRFHEFLCSHLYSDLWLSDKLSYFTECESVADSVWGNVLREYASSALKYALNITDASLQMLEEETELKQMVFELISSDAEFLEGLLRDLDDASWDEIADASKKFVSGTWKAPGYVNHPVKIKVTENRKVVKKSIETVQKIFSTSEKNFSLDIRELTPIAKQLFECVSLFHSIYSQMKREKNIADFSDIEHWAIDLLIERDEHNNIRYSPLAKTISDRFDQVMVDEYQDANEVQDYIYKAVSHEGENLFVVGDVKQSIYGFRQAMPEIFLSRKNTLPLYIREDDNYPSKVILERNFRSRKEVTDYINFTFSLLMSPEIGDIDYNEEEALVPAASYDEADAPCVELHLVECNSKDTDPLVAEAQHIAETIYSICSDTYIKDGETKRKVTFSDIAIIMRSAKKYASPLADELKRYGIPAVCDQRFGFLTSPEISLAVDFLKVVDNPLQDIPLTSVLMSPIYGFTPDDMIKVRCINRKTSIYAALLELASQGDGKASAFLKDLGHLRTLSFTEASDVFISALYDYVNLPAIATATFGKASVSSLCQLVSYAKDFEQGNSKGISAFVSYLEKLVAEKKDLPRGVSDEFDFNSVRIMSVHSSKGLEFPVCILANTHRKFVSDTTKDVLLHSKLGFASKRRDKKLMCSYPTKPREAVALEIRRSEMSEELRILYVAMTRAKEKLIMTAAVNGVEKYTQNILGKVSSNDTISPFVVRGATYLSDWLVMCALKHPGGEALRRLAEDDSEYALSFEDTGNFKVVLAEYMEDDYEEICGEISEEIIYEEVPEEIRESLCKRFDYVYPDEALCSLPQKVTASRLSHGKSKNSDEMIFKSPLFLSDIPLTAAQRGTAFHLFLENCDFASALKDVKAEVERLRSSGVLNDLQADSIDIRKAERFITSSIVAKALTSEKYIREYKFTVNIPAYMVDEEITEDFRDTQVVLQGAVDLIIIDSDGITVVDYKTDRVSSSSELVSLYERQLKLYKAAIEQIFDRPVKNCLIYSIHHSKIEEVI